jgi:hypothetical protein
MRLHEWVHLSGGSLLELSRVSGVSHQTLRRLVRGMLLDKWSLAKKIQEATGGQVTALECVELELDSQKGAFHEESS